MKKRMLAMLFAMMMLAGCGGNAEAPAEQEQESQTKVAIEDDEVYRFLTEQPEEITVEDAVAKGFYTIREGEVQNQQVWDDFMAACARGEEAEVVLCQYTTKGGAVLDHVTHHADGSFDVVTDATRDGYFDEKSVMTPAETYTTLTMLENFTLEEGGKVYTVGVMSNNPDLTAEDFRKSWLDLKIE
ncbi:MAG: hypothetical protein IKT73_05000, partial [Anaerotignum sp.]|nr:hypothetical protein [Anaerotignum sp.]